MVISESSPLASLILCKEFIQYPMWAAWPLLYTLLLSILDTLIRLVRFMSVLLVRYVSLLQCDVTLHHPHVHRLQTDSIWIISVVCQYHNFITNTIHPDLLFPPPQSICSRILVTSNEQKGVILRMTHESQYG